MKVGIDISPLQTGHKIRGVGFYIENLRSSLLKYHQDIYFSFFDSAPADDVDLIHYPYFDPFFKTLPLIKRQKTIVTIHDLTPLIFPDHFPPGTKGSFIWRLQKRAVKNADGIITDSQASKEDIVRLLNLSPSKIDVVSLAPSENIRPMKDLEALKLLEKFHLSSDFALYVGDATWNKNLPNIIKAFESLDIKLVFVGKTLGESNYSDNLWNKDLNWVNETTKNDDKFLKVGFVNYEELSALYSTAKFLIIPSFYEGFGLPIVEAMKCGCPVITSERGSIPEVAGKAAYYVDPENVSEITKAAATVFTNEKMREKLSKDGILQSKKFSWKRTVDQTVNIYEKIIKS